MERVIEIFKEIQDTSGKNDKIAIIKNNAENELFKKCLVFLLDDNIVTGISKKKLSKNIKTKPESIFRSSTWKWCMDYLKIHNTGTDADIYWLQEFVNYRKEEHKEFYSQMITKSLKLGCDSKSVNKALPNLIRTWDVQLGSPYDKLKLKKDEYFYLSQKLNGNRCSFYNGKLVSRQGKEFTGLNHILNDINKSNLQHYFIDGELIRKNTDNISDGENFRIGTGIINSDDERKEEIKLVIFDVFPSKELLNKESDKIYKDRKQYLDGIKVLIDLHKLKNIEVVTMLYEGNEQCKIDEWLQYAVDNDFEGIMLNKNSTYKCKRTTDLIKIKRFYTMDLRVVDAVEGDGRLKGTLGALVVEYKGNIVNVGSGYSDEQRNQIWDNRDFIIGQIIEVKYKEITRDKNSGLESLQFPIFVRIRGDKTEPSYN